MGVFLNWMILYERDVTVHKIYGSVCTSVLGSWFGTISVQQKKREVENNILVFI